MKKQKIVHVLVKSGAATSNKEAQQLIDAGRVKVEEKLVVSHNFQLNPNTKKVFLDDKLLKISKDNIYVILNKPMNLVCDRNDLHGRKTIYDFIKTIKERDENSMNSLFAVGRLDANSTGLLILTNDGNFANRILQPDSNITKKYFVKIIGKLTDDENTRLLQGIEITLEKDGVTETYKTDKCNIEDIKFNSKDDLTSLNIIISEGKNRQIRRMFLAVNHKVTELKRVSIGNLLLGDLKEGGYKFMKKEEISGLVFG